MSLDQLTSDRTLIEIIPAKKTPSPDALADAFGQLSGVIQQSTPPIEHASWQYLLWTPNSETIKQYLVIPPQYEAIATRLLTSIYPTAEITTCEFNSLGDLSSRTTSLRDLIETAATTHDQKLICREWTLSWITDSRTTSTICSHAPSNDSLADIETTLLPIIDYLTETDTPQLFDITVQVTGEHQPTTGPICATDLRIGIRSLTATQSHLQEDPVALTVGGTIDLGTHATDPAVKCHTEHTNKNALTIANEILTGGLDSGHTFNAPPTVLPWLTRSPSADPLIDKGVESCHHPANQLTATQRDRYRHDDGIQVGHLIDGDQMDHRPFTLTPRQAVISPGLIMRVATDTSDDLQSLLSTPPAQRQMPMTELACDFGQAACHRDGPVFLIDLAGTGRDTIELGPHGLAGTALTAIQAETTTPTTAPATYVSPAVVQQLTTDSIRDELLETAFSTEAGYVLDCDGISTEILSNSLPAVFNGLLTHLHATDAPVTVCLDGRELLERELWDVLTLLEDCFTTPTARQQGLLVDLIFPLDNSITSVRACTHFRTIRQLADTVIYPSTITPGTATAWNLPTPPTGTADWAQRDKPTIRFLRYTDPITNTITTLQIDINSQLETPTTEYAHITVLDTEANPSSNQQISTNGHVSKTSEEATPDTTNTLTTDTTVIGEPPAVRRKRELTRHHPIHNPPPDTETTPDELSTEPVVSSDPPTTTTTNDPTTDPPDSATDPTDDPPAEIRDTIYMFPVNDYYLFEHFFDGSDAYSQLAEYHNDDKYRFEIPADRFDDVRDHLENLNYRVTVVEELADFCVVTDDFEFEILRQSVVKWEDQNHTVYLLKDKDAIETVHDIYDVTPLTETTLPATPDLNL